MGDVISLRGGRRSDPDQGSAQLVTNLNMAGGQGSTDPHNDVTPLSTSTKLKAKGTFRKYVTKNRGERGV